jgi:hypothetical protein
MCKESIKSLLLVILFLLVGVVFAEENIHFPFKTKGISAIKNMVHEKEQDYSIHYQTIKYKEGTELFVVNHNTGSGVSNMYVYVYICSTNDCHILAMRHAFKEGLLAELTSDEKELVLKSEDGVVYLRMPFNWPRPPED